MSFVSVVDQVKTVPAGTRVGYAGTFVCARTTTLAVVAGGLRGRRAAVALEQTGQVLVGGTRCPIAGRISMDLTEVDVTDLPSPPGRGDEAVFFGTQSGARLGVEEAAAAADTVRLGDPVRRRAARAARHRRGRPRGGARVEVPVKSVLEAIGRPVLRLLEGVGRFFELLGQTIRGFFLPPYQISMTAKQVVRVGVDSVPVVFLTALFTGGVLALQTFKGFQRFHAEGYIGSVVALSMLRELGPVLTGLMVTGRAGSAMAAELGSMRVTEQIDALVSLATDPVQYLFVPRVLASIIVPPMLVVLADVTGILGGYLVAVQYLGANPVVYMNNTFQFLSMEDMTSGLIKAAVFGLLFSMIGCQTGYDTKGGAEGVGTSTTAAVVLGSLAILIADFFLTKVLF